MGCSFKSLFRLTARKSSKPFIVGPFVTGIHSVTGEFPALMANNAKTECKPSCFFHTKSGCMKSVYLQDTMNNEFHNKHTWQHRGTEPALKRCMHSVNRVQSVHHLKTTKKMLSAYVYTGCSHKGILRWWRHDIGIRITSYWPFVQWIHRLLMDSLLKGPVKLGFDGLFFVNLHKLWKEQLMQWEDLTLVWPHRYVMYIIGTRS